MNNTFADMQAFGRNNLESAMKLWGEWGRGWQAIATEMGDYSKRSIEDGSQTFQKLISAKSMEQAFEIQSSYAKRAAELYFQELNKIGSMVASLAKDTMKPMDRLIQHPAMR